MLNSSLPNSQDIVLGSMFWQSFTGIMNYNFTSNETNLIFQLNQNGAGYYLNGTSINDATLKKPTQYNFAIQNGEWPGLVPLIYVQNIENTQNAGFLIDITADVTTTFASNCTQNYTGSVLSCAAEPLSADEMFTAEGFAYSGTYNSTSISGYTTSGIVRKGQFCLTDILTAD